MNNLKGKASTLISVSRRDSSVFTPLNSYHLAIGNLINKNEFLKFFESKETTLKVNLFSDSTINEIRNQLLHTNNYKNFLTILNQFGINVSTSKLKKLSEEFNAELKLEIIDNALNFAKTFNQKLMALNRKANEICKNKGTWNLFLTRFFLKGVTPYKKQAIKAPLYFQKVEINFIDNQIFLKKISDYNELNEKLILFLQKDIGKQKKPISRFFEFNDINSIKKQLEEIIETNLKISEENVFLFKKENSFDIESNYLNLVIEDNICLGIFEPWGGRLKDDLEKLIELNEIDSIFKKPKFIKIDDIKSQELYQPPLIQIDKLDIYQKWAIRSSLLNDTIIHGSPGTGKSEVITNIIANIIANKNNVLIVSEKIAALEVIKKRLKDLSIFSLCLYNTTDKETFYNSFLELIDFLGDSWKNNYFRYSESGDKLKFLNQVFDNNENLKKTFEKIISFKNNKYHDLSFLDYVKELNEFGGLNKLNKIVSLNLINKYSETMNFLKVNEIDFFKKLESFFSFCSDQKIIESQADFLRFHLFAVMFKKYFEENNNKNNPNLFLETIEAKSKALSLYLNSKKNYQEILYENHARFYEDVRKYQSIKKKYFSIVNNALFDNFANNIGLLSEFLKKFNYAKEADKKYLFDLFVTKLEVEDKKPWNKIYLKKLSDVDKQIINDFVQLIEMHLEKYIDFDFIIKNLEMFNPLSVLYYFNKKLFNACFEFVQQGYLVFDYEFIKINNEFQLNLSNWKQINKLLNLKLYFEHDNYEITNDLIQNKVDNLTSINWSSYVKVLKDEVKNLILNKLANINFSYKEMVQKAVEVAKSKNKPTIYKFIREYEPILRYLFPIWILRPDDVALFIPLEKNYFDYGIYDEASQMFLEKSYPILYRSRINVVAGDENQLRPSSFFSSFDFDEEDNEYEDSQNDDNDTESLLDKAIISDWNGFMLQNHYRSESKDLISFSAINIYKNKLNYATKNGSQNNKALEVINVNGNFVDQRNIKEAEYAIDLVKKYVHEYKSILIITLNAKQSSYINSLLLNNEYSTVEITNRYLNQTIEVVNLENVQGNEADLVIMSMGFGKKNDSASVRANFGPLIQNYGKNRLNVAITRAKKKMIVLKSLSSQDVKKSDNENLILFLDYLDFLDSQKSSHSISEETNSNLLSLKLFLEISNSITNLISQYNLEIVPNYKVGNKNLDLAILDPRSNFVLLGIQIESWNTNLSLLERQIDLDQLNFFKARNYQILKLFEHEWAYNKDLVLNEIIKRIKSFNH